MKYMQHTHSSKKLVRGVGLVEAVVVISIMSSAFAALLGSAVIFLRIGLGTAEKAQALFLVDESIEAVQFLRDQGYTSHITPLVGSGPMYLAPTTGGFVATTTNTAIFGAFTRSIEVEEVYRRNADDDIVDAASGDPKTLDPNTAHVTVTITWSKGTNVTETYVTNLYDN